MTLDESANGAWRKSSRSGQGGSNCVEVQCLGRFVAIRDSKDPSGAVLRTSGTAWREFVSFAARNPPSPR